MFRSSCAEMTSKVCADGRVNTSAPVFPVGCQELSRLPSSARLGAWPVLFVVPLSLATPEPAARLVLNVEEIALPYWDRAATAGASRTPCWFGPMSSSWLQLRPTDP